MDELYAAEGEPIVYRDEDTGEEATFPNTPMNRILSEYPEILRARWQGKDDAASEQRTFYQQLKTVLRIYRQQKRSSNGIDTIAAKELFDAGKLVSDRTAQDRLRHGINAGGVSGGASPGSESYVRELTSVGGVSLSDLRLK